MEQEQLIKSIHASIRQRREQKGQRLPTNIGEAQRRLKQQEVEETAKGEINAQRRLEMIRQAEPER